MDGTLSIFGHAFILTELGFTRIQYINIFSITKHLYCQHSGLSDIK